MVILGNLKIRIFASWRLFLAQKFFNIFFPRNCPQKCLQKNGFRKNKFVTSYFRRNGINFIFWWFFGPFWPPGPKMRIFGKKRFLHVVSPYWPLTSCQKSERSLEPILRKFWKNSKNPIFDPKMAILGKMGFFSKNRAPSLFYKYFCLISWKKSEKSLEPILRKTPNRLTDWRTWVNL